MQYQKGNTTKTVESIRMYAENRRCGRPEDAAIAAQLVNCSNNGGLSTVSTVSSAELRRKDVLKIVLQMISLLSCLYKLQ